MEGQIEGIVGTDIERMCGATHEDTSMLVDDKYITDPDFAVVAYSCQEIKPAPYLAEEKSKEGYVLGGEAIISNKTQS